MDASPRLVYCGIEPARFPASSFRKNRVSVRRRTRKVFAVTSEPKPKQTGTGPASSSSPSKTVNGSSRSSPPLKPFNGASMRMGEVSQEIKRVRAQMEENEQLSVLMKGLRGQNLRDSQFADDSVKLRLVEVDESSEFLPLVYDPASITAYWGKRPRAVATRIVQLLSVAGGFLSRIAWDIVTKKIKENEVARAIELRDIVTSLGPAYIKLGQALSIRPDILSPVAMVELQKLCDKVPSFPDDVAMALIEEELGQPWHEIYSELSSSPIAAASLGQVYKGRLKENGDLVAVKVQRPFVLETVTVDLFIIRNLGLALRKFPQVSIDVVGLVDEWAARFFEELDYVNEGENGTLFAEMMKKDLPQVVIPKTYEKYTSRKVLTTGWIEGEKLSQSTESDVGELVNVGVICYLKQLLDTGFFHADPHPGNLIRTPQKPPVPWTAINASIGVVVITLLVGHIFHAAINRIAQVENDYHEMMELKARAEAADVAKSQFLATVSHEIRTPMNGVLGMLQMLMDTELDAAQLDYAQTAHNSGKDLISLINDVLDQAKIESGRLEPEFVPFHLHDVLDNVLSLFSSKANQKGIELAIYVSDRVPEVVIGDPGRFRQIITNLVGNSIKFTQDKGHIFVSVHLADDVRSKVDVKDKVLEKSLNSVQHKSDKVYNTLSGFPVVDRWKSWENFKMLDNTNTMEQLGRIKLLVTVEDTGVGIPREAQVRIFTPFMQADSSTSRTYGGTGIGLSISRCLVELMGGEIGFVSEPGTGSTFSFTVTFTEGERNSLDPKWQQYVPDVSEFRGLRALVIDDKSIRAEVTRYHLQRLEMAVHVANSMQLACSYLSDTCSTSVLPQLALVLIDKDVWDKEIGLVLHYMLKQQRRKGGLEISRNLPKIFLLATSISETDRDELKSDGIVTLLTKPLRLSVLIGCFQEDPESSKKLQQKRKKPSLGHLLKGKQILVVDDNMVNRRVAEGALKKHGAIVTCVDCGRAAVDKLTPPHNFDACFMDLQMPEMDGFQATRQIRHLENEINEQIASGESSAEMFGNVGLWHVPILAMTADVIQASNEQCMKCGMDDYVSKPFEDEQLYTAVARFFMSG